MPTYDYKCDTCKHRWEANVPVDNRDSQLCPFCGDADVLRVINSAPIHFKGTGFYATDK